MHNIHNGQATAQLAGFGYVNRTLHYVSMIATSTVVKSFKASLIKGASHNIDGHGTYKVDKNATWNDFKSAIPHSPFVHYVFISSTPTTLLLVNAPHSAQLTDAFNSLDITKRRAFSDERATFVKTHLPALLRRNLNEHTPLPIPPEWEEEVFKETQSRHHIAPGTSMGDCAYIGIRIEDDEAWKRLISSLVLSGRVH